MRLFDFALAPAAQRVRMFLTEKGLKVPSVEVNLREGEQHREPFMTMNPFRCVPVLELDDGTFIAESVTICRYLEELHPEPSLFGRLATERAVIDMWNRRVELDGYVPALHATRNLSPRFQGRVIPGTRLDLPQLPAIVERGREMLKILLQRLELQLASTEFIAGNRFTIADITGYFTVRMVGTLEVPLDEDYPAVARWFGQMSGRQSAQF